MLTDVCSMQLFADVDKERKEAEDNNVLDTRSLRTDSEMDDTESVFAGGRLFQF
jgi:hypothetical protein